MTPISRLIGIGIFSLLFMVSATAWGVEIMKDKLWLDTYLRVTNIVGDGFNEGVDPSLGADFGLTLFQRSYFESALKYRHEKKLEITAQLAIDNQAGFFTSAGDGGNIQLLMKDFYAEFLDVGGAGNSLWVGARKYQVLDEHNIFGLGYRMNVSRGLRVGFAQGMRRDFGYWGAKTNSDGANASFNLSGPDHLPPFRTTSMVDIERMITENSNVKVLAEYQRLGPVTTTASWTDSAGKNLSATYNLAPVSGYLTGMELNFWGERWNHSSSLIFGNGDVAGSPLSKINTRGSPREITDIDGTNPLTVEHYKGHNQRITSSHSGAKMGDLYSYSYLAAMSFDRMTGADNRSMFLLNVRPFYHFDKSFHFGLDASRTTMLRGIDRPGYTTVAPILRYAMSQDNYGKPYMQVFFGYTVFDRHYSVYGSPRKTLGTGGIQFEAFF